MFRDKRIPAWLIRRGYFKRIERWAKPGKPARADDPAGQPPRATPSNIVPFPDQPGAARRIQLPDLRNVGTA